MRLVALVILLVLSGVARAATAATGAANVSPPAMRGYHSRYYVIHSDLDPDDVKEAGLRMTAMAREYRAWIGGDGGPAAAPVPVYLFRTRQEYCAAGGASGSSGFFDQTKLMAFAGEHADGRTWHVVQHEGFHQFASSAMRGRLPVWLDEGMAEYFGESLFTGDGYVSGLIPPWRLTRVRREIRQGRFMSMGGLMGMSKTDWNARLRIENYDQAWSIVQFLAHGPDEKIRQSFTALMKAISHGTRWDEAWRQYFADDGSLEPQWRDYWLNLPDNPTAVLYGKAMVATLTSFVGRAAADKHVFSSFDAFVASAKGAHFKITGPADDWPPPGLLQAAVAAVERSRMTCTLEQKDGNPRIVAVMADGTRLSGHCSISDSRVVRVWVEEDKTAFPPRPILTPK